MQQRGVRRVAVIGTGTIGASWTANFLARGLIVRATDPAPDAEQRLRQFVDACWPALARLADLPPAPPHDALTFCTDPESAVAGVDFVQEQAPEREEIKKPLLARIDAVLPPEIVIASSSSGLLISRLQSACQHPERCVGGQACHRRRRVRTAGELHQRLPAWLAESQRRSVRCAVVERHRRAGHRHRGVGVSAQHESEFQRRLGHVAAAAGVHGFVSGR